MKNIILKSIITVFGIVFFYACSLKKNISANIDYQVADTVGVSYVDSVSFEDFKKEELKVKQINFDSFLKANVDIEIEFQDSVIQVTPDFDFFEYGPIVSFAKLEDNNRIFAIVCPYDYVEEVQTNVLFYELKGKQWVLISKFDNTEEVNYFKVIDLNNDGEREIHSIGYPNVNGNFNNYFYSYSKAENEFINGGGFYSGVFEFKPKQSRIEAYYVGSWYMPNIKTIYHWKNNKLIPYKEIEVGLKIADMKHSVMYIKYSENLNLDEDSLQLIYKKSYRGKKFKKFYENFFENN